MLTSYHLEVIILRIVHVAESFAGGTFDFIVNLTNELPIYDHVIVHGMRENTPSNYQEFFPVNTKFYLWKNVQRDISIKKDFSALIQLIRFLYKIENVDVIHVHSSKAGFLGRVAAKCLGLSNKVIYTSHGVAFLRTDISFIKKKWFIFFEKIAECFGGKIVACSKSEADVFKSNGINNVIAIPNGVHPDFTKKKSSNFCRLDKKDQFVIGTMGRICRQKNPYLFNQIAKENSLNSKIKFLWIGDGELRHELTESNIEVSGWIDSIEVFDQLNRVDIYLSTSSWEGLSLGVLQAMALKKPLLLSDCVGNRDAVVEGRNGYLFREIDDVVRRINYLFLEQNKCKQCGEESFLLLNEFFSMSKMIDSYINLYEDLIDQKV